VPLSSVRHGNGVPKEPVHPLPTGNVSLPTSSSLGGDQRPGAEPLGEPAGKPLSRGEIILLLSATFGAGMALIVPMAYSLALRLNELAPDREDYLGYILGVGSVFSLFTAPLTGILSDRTRSRFGRRRPFTLAGTVVGLIAIPLLVFAPSIPILTAGWILSTVGWGTAAGSIGNYQADRLPPQQRGQIAGLTGMTMQVSPVVGILIAGNVAADRLLLFLVPAAIGAVLVLLFIILVKEPDSRGTQFDHALSVGKVFGSFLFKPREHPDFAWNWLGRFVFFLGLSLTTSYSTYFYAQRLDIPVEEVASVLAVISGIGILSSTIGSIVGGWLSDHLGRRRLFVVLGVGVFASGSVVSAFADSFAILLAGSLLSSLGIAAFLSVSQAIVLDVLPGGSTEAGRYMAVTSFSQKIPSAVAPLLAPMLLLIGAPADRANYSALYLICAVLAVAGGSIISTKVKGIQ